MTRARPSCRAPASTSEDPALNVLAHPAGRTERERLSDRLTVVDAEFGTRLLGLADLFAYRELLLLLAWRDVKVRYKQTLIGATWAVVQPLLTMVVFTVIFAHFLHVPSSGDQPYAVVVFAALLPWQLFSGSLGRSSTSLVSSGALISKVYFPRVIVPIAALGAPLVDFGISAVILGVLMAGYGVAPGWGLLAVPLFLAFALAVALAGGIWLSALHARYRDVGYVVPFLLQLLMYLSPIAYPLTAVPERWRTLFQLNPIAEIVGGFRWGFLDGPSPDLLLLGIDVVATVLLLGAGLSYFARMQRTVADVI